MALKEVIWQEFTKLANIGAVFIIVTNLTKELAYCDQLLYLKNGKLLIQGTESDFNQTTGKPSLEESLIFLGSNEDGANISNCEETTHSNH